MYADWLEWFFPIMMQIFILADLMMLMGKPRGEGEGGVVCFYILFLELSTAPSALHQTKKDGAIGIPINRGR